VRPRYRFPVAGADRTGLHRRARTSVLLSKRVFWATTCSRTRLLVVKLSGEEGFSLGPVRRRRRSGAPVTVAVVFGPFFVDLVAFLRSGPEWPSGGLEVTRLQRRAPTVSGRRPRASRAVRGGSAAAPSGYFRYWLFWASRGRYTTALGLAVRLIVSRSLWARGKCGGAVRGALRATAGLDGWHRLLLAGKLAPPESELRRRLYLSGGPLGASLA
jgi:hypothetical protein